MIKQINKQKQQSALLENSDFKIFQDSEAKQSVSKLSNETESQQPFEIQHYMDEIVKNDQQPFSFDYNDMNYDQDKYLGIKSIEKSSCIKSINFNSPPPQKFSQDFGEEISKKEPIVQKKAIGKAPFKKEKEQIRQEEELEEEDVIEQEDEESSFSPKSDDNDLESSSIQDIKNKDSDSEYKGSSYVKKKMNKLMNKQFRIRAANDFQKGVKTQLNKNDSFVASDDDNSEYRQRLKQIKDKKERLKIYQQRYQQKKKMLQEQNSDFNKQQQKQRGRPKKVESQSNEQAKKNKSIVKLEEEVEQEKNDDFVNIFAQQFQTLNIHSSEELDNNKLVEKLSPLMFWFLLGATKYFTLDSIMEGTIGDITQCLLQQFGKVSLFIPILIDQLFQPEPLISQGDDQQQLIQMHQCIFNAAKAYFQENTQEQDNHFYEGIKESQKKFNKFKIYFLQNLIFFNVKMINLNKIVDMKQEFQILISLFKQFSTDIKDEITKQNFQNILKDSFQIKSQEQNLSCQYSFIEKDEEIINNTIEGLSNINSISQIIEYIKSLQQNDNADQVNGGDELNCKVCNNGESFEDNLIVICSSCEAPIHQNCYGLQIVPDTDFICQQCEILGKEKGQQIRCPLCPNIGGVMKQTTYTVRDSNVLVQINPKYYNYLLNKTTISEEQHLPSNQNEIDSIVWCHLSCAIYNPEVIFGDKNQKILISGNYFIIVVQQEQGFENIEKSKLNSLCAICDKNKQGSVIFCSHRRCTQKGFHAECALKNKQLFKTFQEGNQEIHVIYCKDHSKRMMENKTPNKSDYKPKELQKKIYNQYFKQNADPSSKQKIYDDASFLQEIQQFIKTITSKYTNEKGNFMPPKIIKVRNKVSKEGQVVQQIGYLNDSGTKIFKQIKWQLGNKKVHQEDNLPENDENSLISKNKQFQQVNKDYYELLGKNQNKPQKLYSIGQGKRPKNKVNKFTYEDLQMEPPETFNYNTYSKDWCRYCGARVSSNFTRGPWAPRTLCTVHYIACFLQKKLDLSSYPNLPSKPINLLANTELNFISKIKEKYPEYDPIQVVGNQLKATKQQQTEEQPSEFNNKIKVEEETENSKKQMYQIRRKPNRIKAHEFSKKQAEKEFDISESDKKSSICSKNIQQNLLGQFNQIVNNQSIKQQNNDKKQSDGIQQAKENFSIGDEKFIVENQ